VIELPHRQLVTNWLVEQATEHFPVLVGDGEAPPEGGWDAAGEEYHGYVVLLETQGTPNHQDPIGAPDSGWALGYALRCAGGSRRHVSWIADNARARLLELAPIRLDAPDRWALTRVHFSSLGGATRNDSTDPKHWETTDSLALWLSR
jgi:hypothetical protein